MPSVTVYPGKLQILDGLPFNREALQVARDWVVRTMHRAPCTSAQLEVDFTLHYDWQRYVHGITVGYRESMHCPDAGV